MFRAGPVLVLVWPHVQCWSSSGIGLTTCSGNKKGTAPHIKAWCSVKEALSIVGSFRDREVACSASDLQGSNFESCVWRTVSSHSSEHPQEVLLAQFSLYVHKGGLKPALFLFI